MKYKLFFVCLIAFLTRTTSSNGTQSFATQCKISIQKDLNPFHPLLLRAKPINNANTNNAYYLPENKYGDITLTSSDTINLTCPGGQVLINGKSTGKSTLQVRCSSRTNFEDISNGAIIQSQSLTCSKILQSARYTGKKCLGNLHEIEIGVQIDGGHFLRDILVCFDKVNQNTAYSFMNMTGSIRGSQFKVPRPNFDEAGFYNTGKHKLQNLYSVYVQRINVNKQLGLDQKSKKYIGDGYFFLSRGHLTAKADFVYGSQQNGTFYYVNVAPQWQNFNEGNWNELEKSVRKYSGDKQLDLQVYTGTHGVLSFKHEATKVETPLYLYNDNGHRGIGVPKFYWKVVYEPKTKAGVAFVGVNNPHKNGLLTGDVLCEDICGQLGTWNLSWNRTNFELGYSYCCKVDELKRQVKNIPNLVVTKILS